MELGADAVLVNTAIAVAETKTYGRSFRMAVIAGRKAYELAQQYKHAVASSPLTAFCINK
jgi:thiazole synthase ThiGH ThiG subunit